ncbi:hypothetical protein [Paractinoplanes atraurantiacus]|uniref:Uncharacterized protein n=1 Tax=Paractinoplanes atraurantiacus TaxID=1036182 RepID=A0A285HEW6_9ACTN|nr:hypothetical protein [Actinoplanes atraurantiacus]SNY34270.1 hypothetical protein SAMN05421748_104255 [Actinoplanes atraurantiacus]
MFTSKNTAERTAAQAWDYLSSAMAAAGDSAKETADLAGKAGRKARKASRKASKQSYKLAGKASDKADVAWTRANAAYGALAGRRPGRPWGLIVGVGLLGVAIGWAAASSARAALERQAENEELELAETAVVVTPTYDTK